MVFVLCAVVEAETDVMLCRASVLVAMSQNCEKMPLPMILTPVEPTFHATTPRTAPLPSHTGVFIQPLAPHPRRSAKKALITGRRPAALRPSVQLWRARSQVGQQLGAAAGQSSPGGTRSGRHRYDQP